jgi:hypothetical protein
LHNRLLKDDSVLKSLGGDLSSAERRFRAAVCAARATISGWLCSTSSPNVSALRAL